MSKLEYYEHCITSLHNLYEGHYSSIETFKELISKSDIRSHLYHSLKYNSHISQNGIIVKDLTKSEIENLQLDIEVHDNGYVFFMLPTLIVDVCRFVKIPEVAIPGQPYQPAKTETVVEETRRITRKESSWNGGQIRKIEINLDQIPQQRKIG